MTSEITSEPDLTVIEFPSTRPTAARPSVSAGLSDAASELTELLVSPRTGMARTAYVSRAVSVGRGMCESRIRFGDRIPNSRPFAKDSWINTGAVRRTRGEALVAGLAETVERYAWSRPCPRGEFLSLDRIRESGLPIHEFVRKGETERDSSIPVEWDPREGLGIPWVEGVELRSGKRSWAPAGLLTDGEPTHPDHGDHLCDVTTNGMAAGPDAHFAQIGGVTELVERDAYLVTHVNRLPLPELDLSTATEPDIHSALAGIRARPGLSIRAWDMTLDIAVPTVLCAIILDVDGSPAVRVSAAAHVCPEQATRKAVIEAVQLLGAVRADQVRQRRTTAVAPVAPGALKTLDDHLLLGDRPDYVAELDWLLQDRARLRTLPEMREMYGPKPEQDDHLPWILGRLDRVGLAAHGFDLTPPEVAGFTGLRVWRTMVPGIQPMSMGPVVGLDSDRLRFAPVRAGFRATPLQENEFNPMPHCFP